MIYFSILLATYFNLIIKYKACGLPKEINNGNWEITSKVDIWDENVGSRSIEVIQQVQYICEPNYQLAKGATTFVNCDHNTNTFTPEPPVCGPDTGQSLMLVKLLFWTIIIFF